MSTQTVTVTRTPVQNKAPHVKYGVHPSKVHRPRGGRHGELQAAIAESQGVGR